MLRRAFLAGTFALARSARAEEGDLATRARWVAGLPSSTATTAAWQSYASAEDERWQRTREARLVPMQAFGARELLPLLGRDAVVFYPFGGPDALHALALFGAARRFLLVGLEPVGSLPGDAAALARLGASMASVHRLSFFRTQEMASDFKDGVVGALVATVVRMHGTVSSVRITETTATIEWDGRRLDYVQADLSNPGLKQKPRLLARLEELGPHVALVKAAMYLLAEARFSTMRNLLLANASLIVQDDTGVPFRAFDPSWTTRLFGRYEPPRAPFADRVQPDLVLAYARRVPPPLGFGFGYAVEAKRSNLLVASKARA